MNIRDRFFQYVVKTNSCWLWTGCVNEKGYGRFRISRKREERAHRFSWVLSGKEIPKDKLLCHKCDTPSCVNPKHLFLGTPKENTFDMLKKKREIRGSMASWSKLTPEQAAAIRDDPRPQRQIAKDYGVCQQNVSLIKRRKNWRVLI